MSILVESPTISDTAMFSQARPQEMHLRGNATMERAAMVTGATDGIGRATAIELAKRGFTVHLLGRNEARGQETVGQLEQISPARPHKLYLYDLGSMRENRRFLEEYTECHSRLDLLILNANARKRKTTVTEDGVETTFAVGCLSRYMYAVMLNPLLKMAEGSRVMHIGDATRISALDYAAITGRGFGILKASLQSYSGDALLAYWFNAGGMTKVPHEIVSPGVVNTEQMRELRFLPKKLLRLFGVLEPDESGRRLVEHVLSTDAHEVAGKFFYLEKEKKVSRKLVNGRPKFEELLAFCEKTTGIEACQMM